MQRWREDQFVAATDLRLAARNRPDIPVMQRVIKKLDVFAQVEEFVRLHRAAAAPTRCRGCTECRLPPALRAFERRAPAISFRRRAGRFP